MTVPQKLEIDPLQVLKNCIKLCQDHPDTKYERAYPGNGPGSCLYTKGAAGGQCGCLIGQGIQMISQEHKDYLFLLESRLEAGKGLGGVHVLLNKFFIRKSDMSSSMNIGDVLEHMQTLQDDGSTWGSCLKNNLNRIENLKMNLGLVRWNLPR